MDPGATILQGFQERNAYKANADMQRGQARVVIDQAAREEGAARRERDQIAGAQIAATGASGITSDSTETFIIDQAVQSELNALNARYRGAVEAAGLRNSATQNVHQARAALTGSFLKAGAQIVSGAAKGGASGGSYRVS